MITQLLNLCPDVIPYGEYILTEKEARARLDYYSRLGKIRENAEKNIRGFPKWYCVQMARAVQLSLQLEAVAGYYVPKTKFGISFDRYHAWNFDRKNNLYVDLTQDQFTNVPNIVVMPKDNPILKIDELKTQQLRESF